MASNPPVSPTAGEPQPQAQPQPQAREKAPRNIECRFCGCELTPSGDWVALSDKARGYRDASIALADLQAKYDALVKQENDRLEKLKKPEGQGDPPAQSRGLRIGK